MTINQPEACLTEESMERLAHGKFPAAQLVQIEEHIGSCERCRRMLESASLDSQWNDEVLPILQTPSDDSGSFVELKDVGHEEPTLESLLQLLGPTDDPHKFGRIGTYEVVGIIGRGGMGVVFKAFDAALNRFVAIKMLLPQLAISGAARKRFAREGQAAAAVIDDNVLPIYSVAEWQGIPYLVTQYSRGITLQKRILEQGPLELKEILRIGMQTARGLAAAHTQGLVHRDVKPSNILLDGSVERALLTDFGLARAVDDASITRTGVIAGTPQYMSPEQARGGSVDARSDLFGLGCVLYTMCTGRPPFRADNSYAVLRLITDAEPRPIREINPEIPDWLCTVIARLMAKAPNDRFASASEVANLLESCLAHIQQPTVTPLPEQLRITQSVNRRRNMGRWIAAIGAVAMSLAGLFGLVISLSSQDGTLLIESNVDDVIVRVSQGDTVVRKLTVTKSGTKLNVAAGSYTVAIEGNIDGMVIENDRVNLRRGKTEIIKLTYQRPVESSTSTDPTPMDPTLSAHPSNPIQKNVTPEDAGHGIQKPPFVGVNWRPIYLSILSTPSLAKRYSLTESQQQEIQKRTDDFVRSSATVDIQDDLLTATQAKIQDVLTREQDKNLRRDIWMGWNVTKFRDPKRLFQLRISDEQQRQIDAIWQASQERVGPIKQPAIFSGLPFEFTPERLAVEGPEEWQRVFHEVFAILTIEQRSQFLREIQDLIVDGIQTDPVQNTLAVPNGAVHEMIAPPNVQMALAFPTINWRQVYLGKAMETRFARQHQLTEEQQQRMHAILQNFLRTATPATRSLDEHRAQSDIQNLLTVDQDWLLRREIWIAMNATRLRVSMTHEQLGLNSEQRRQIEDIWKKFESEVQQNGGRRADGTDTYELIFDEIFEVLTAEQRRLFLFKFQDPIFHSGTQLVPFGVDRNPEDLLPLEKDPPRLVDVLNLHLRRERERFPLLDRMLDDIRLLEGGGLEILERPVREDREQYAKDHPELAKAFEAWQNDYRDVLRATEIIPELFQEDTRPIMVTVARLLIQSEDIPGISKEQLAFANQELGEYPTDKLVERVFLGLGASGSENLRRNLRESGANVPHTGTHEDHLRIAEKAKTHLLFARLYCAIEESEMFRQIRKTLASADPSTELLFEESHAIPNDKVLNFLSRRGHEEVRYRQRAYHALPPDSVSVKWQIGDQELQITNPNALVITHVIIDRKMDGHVLWKCYGKRRAANDPSSTTWLRPDPYPKLAWYGPSRKAMCRMEMELVSYEPAQRELALTAEQQKQINEINVSAIPFHANRDLSQQSIEAADRILQILQPPQRARLDQILLQRLGIAAFDMNGIRETLELSQEQQQRIRQAWNDHSKRVEMLDVVWNDQNIAAQIGKIDASELKQAVADHAPQKFDSELRVWNEVYWILNAVQRDRFETLRGSQVKSTEAQREGP